MQEFLAGLSQEAEVLLVLSIILFAGFVMTRLTNTLDLPEMNGYILVGILIGPYGLNLTPMKTINSVGFVSDLALAFIAFGMREFFKQDVMKKTGGKIITITVFETLTAGVLMTLFMRLVFHMDWDFALILGTVTTATAPASTMMAINQYKAKGEFVNALLQIVALDDVVCPLAFSIMAAVTGGHATGSPAISDVMMPIVFNLPALLLGLFCGYFLSRLLIPTRSKDNRLILTIAMLLGIPGIYAAVNTPPLLSCTVLGASYISLTNDKKLYRQISNLSPPVMSVFFIMSGMNLDIRALATIGVVGVSYFIVRIVRKYLGAYISCALTGINREIRSYVGLALVLQAGVATDLAFLGRRLLPPETGKLMLTIILSSLVLYETVGPISAKMTLLLSENISGKDILNKMVTTGQEEQEEQERQKGQEEQERNSEQDERQEEIKAEESDSDSDEEEGEKLACHEADIDGSVDEKNSVGNEADSERDSGGDEAGNQGDSAEGRAGSEEDSGHELTDYIREIPQGVDEQDEFDIEQDLLSERQEKRKKSGKEEKQGEEKQGSWEEEAIMVAAPFSAPES